MLRCASRYDRRRLAKLPEVNLGRRDHIAGSDDLMVAMTAYEAACRHWPGKTITLRQSPRVIEDSRKVRLA
jgi:hypothetical protein